MTTENQTDKSLISGGNAEALKSEAPAAAASVADVLYPDAKTAEVKVEAKVETKADAPNPGSEKPPAEQTPEQKAAADKVAADKKIADDKAVADKAAADKAEADRIAAMTPEEKKAHDDKVAADKVAKEAADAEAKKNKVPVDLTDMKLPEGFKANPEVLADLTKLVNEHGLSKETAEALAPVGAKIAENAVKRINDGYADIRSGWRDEVAADPVLGSKEQMAIADAGLEAYGTPGLRKLLDETGIGDHPEVIRAFHKIGKTVKPDGFVKGGSGDTRVANPEDAMYPTMKS